MHVVTVLFIRNGAVIGSRDYFRNLAGETDAPENSEWISLHSTISAETRLQKLFSNPK